MSAKKNNHRIRAEFKYASGFNLHEDAKEALEQLAVKLPNYPKYMIVSFAIMDLKEKVEKEKITETDDLEDRLNLLT